MNNLKNKIFLSIIIPFHNRVNLLFTTLESIMLNNYNSYEIILIDDGSSTNETLRVKKYIQDKDIKYYKINKSERGFARNFGAKKANGFYLNFFDSDDICINNHVIETVKFANKYDFPKIFAHSYLVKNINKKINKKITYKTNLNKYIFYNNIISCNSVIIEKNLFLKYQFCENKKLSGSEDWDLWLRLANENRFLGSRSITSQIIDHDFRSTRKQNLSKEIIRLNILKKRVLDKNIINLSKKNTRIVLSEIFFFKSMAYSNISKNKKLIIVLFLKSIFLNKLNIFKKRSLVIIRNLIF